MAGMKGLCVVALVAAACMASTEAFLSGRISAQGVSVRSADVCRLPLRVSVRTRGLARVRAQPGRSMRPCGRVSVPACAQTSAARVLRTTLPCTLPAGCACCGRLPLAPQGPRRSQAAPVMQQDRPNKKKKTDVLEMDGVVTESLPNAMFRVTLDANEAVRSLRALCGSQKPACGGGRGCAASSVT